MKEATARIKINKLLEADKLGPAEVRSAPSGVSQVGSRLRRMDCNTSPKKVVTAWKFKGQTNVALSKAREPLTRPWVYPTRTTNFGMAKCHSDRPANRSAASETTAHGSYFG
jgi:hypothetical protein